MRNMCEMMMRRSLTKLTKYSCINETGKWRQHQTNSSWRSVMKEQQQIHQNTRPLSQLNIDNCGGGVQYKENQGCCLLTSNAVVVNLDQLVDFLTRTRFIIIRNNFIFFQDASHTPQCCSMRIPTLVIFPKPHKRLLRKNWMKQTSWGRRLWLMWGSGSSLSLTSDEPVSTPIFCWGSWECRSSTSRHLVKFLRNIWQCGDNIHPGFRTWTAGWEINQ